MPATSFEEAVETIHTHEPRFHRDAYLFLRDALDAATKKARQSLPIDGTSHVSAEELLTAFQSLALKEFGPMASTVLGYWGIKDCGDVGAMVFRLIDEGVFSKTEEDSLDQFKNGFDFEEAFEKPFLPVGKKIEHSRG